MKFETEFGCFAYSINENHPVVQRFQKACSMADLPAKLISTFGGSDNNNFIRHGITGIVIACGMNQVHSCKEYSSVVDLEKCSEIVVHLLTM